MLAARMKGPAAPAIQALLATSPDMARRAVTWTASYLHALSIFLQANGAARPEQAKALLDRDASLAKASTSLLLERGGFSRPERMRTLLDRMGVQLYSNAQYTNWSHLMDNRGLSCHIGSGRTRLTAQRLDGWSELHPDLRTPRILERVRRKSDAQALHAIVAFIAERCPESGAAAVRGSLRATHEDIDDWVMGWLARSKLPEPPFPGSVRLTPLRTGAEMMRFARAFANCLENRIDDALAGRSAFYVWTGSEPAIVALGRVGIVGWKMEDAAGVRNARLRPATLRAIRSELAVWGCFLDDTIEDSFRNLGVAWKLL